MALSETYTKKIEYYIEHLPERIYKPTDCVKFDCFYTFDNAKYDAMLNDAELKRSQNYPLNNNL